MAPFLLASGLSLIGLMLAAANVNETVVPQKRESQPLFRKLLRSPVAGWPGLHWRVFCLISALLRLRSRSFSC